MLKVYKLIFCGIACMSLFTSCANVELGSSEEATGTELVDNSEYINPDYDTLVYKTNTMTLTDNELDSDLDGLVNSVELELGTDINKVDTDGDGLSDLVEVLAGLSPLSESSDGVTKDSDRVYDKSYECDELTVKVQGDANVYDMTVIQAESNFNPYIISDIYDIYMPNQHFNSSTVTFKYDIEKVEDSGINEEDLTVFQYTDDGEYIEVASVVDIENKEVSAELQHFSKYCIGDKIKINEPIGVRIAFVVDDSGSMYAKEFCEESPENDIDYKRLDMVNSVVDTIDAEYLLYTFKGSEKGIITEFTKDKEMLKQKVEEVRSEDKNKKFDGTDADGAMYKALKKFDKKDVNRKILILLSDGVNTGTFRFYRADDVIEKAKEKNVQIITIGLGSEIDAAYLASLSAETGGNYQYATNADALTIKNEFIERSIKYNYIDSDGDGVNDSIMLSDSGFNMQQNNFSGKNYRLALPDGRVTGGQCYGISMLNQLYYAGKLKISDDAVDRHLATGLGYALDSDSYISADGYALTDISFFKDENGDGFVDNKQSLYEWDVFSEYNEKVQKYKEEGKYWAYDNGKVIVNPELKEEIGDSRFIDWIEEDIDSTYDGKPVSACERLVYKLPKLSDDEYNNLTVKEKEQYQAILLINNLFSRQKTDTEKTVRLQSDEGMATLMDSIDKGILPVITSSNHAVNAYQVIRNIENPNELYVYLADSNSPDKQNRLKVILKETNKLTLVSAFYNHTNDYTYTVIDEDGVFVDAGEQVDLDVVINKSLL